jgi:hypothetical protein
MHKGMLYEYTVKNGFKRTKYAAMAKQYTKLKLPVIAIQLDELGYTSDDIVELLDDDFNTFNKAPQSCLTPIVSVLNKLYNIDVLQCNVVFDVLDKLKFSQIITHIYLINSTLVLPKDMELKINTYTVTLVNANILSLQNKKSSV